MSLHKKSRVFAPRLPISKEQVILSHSSRKWFSKGRSKNAMQQVSLFVDGANMYYAQKRLGWFIDFRKVLRFFGQDTGSTISEAYYYTGADTQSKARDNSFREYLMSSGYTVRTKAIKQMIDDNTGELVEKANLDIELVIDMFNTVQLFDTCILMSGDSDFERALELVRSKGKRIAVVSHPDMTSRELRNVAGRNYFDLRDLESHIARCDRMPDLNQALLQENEPQKDGSGANEDNAHRPIHAVVPVGFAASAQGGWRSVVHASAGIE